MSLSSAYDDKDIDDIDGLAGEEEDLAKLVKRLTKPQQPLRHGDQCSEVS